MSLRAVRALSAAAAATATLAAFFGATPGCGSSKPAGGFDDGGLQELCANPDCDHDGYASPADCDDGDPQVNPEAYDFKGDGIDNDCSGKADDPVESCETIPAAAPGSPTDFARAADLCAQTSKTTAGTVFDPLVSAAWGQVKGIGPGQRIWTSATKPVQQTNIVSAFGGNAPRRGRTMAGLANGPWGSLDPRGSAALDDPQFKLNDACADIPLAGADCTALTNGAPAGSLSVQDWAELTLQVKVPSNAHAMAFDFAFFSSEFNQFWSSALNDAFFVLVTSKVLAGANVAKDDHDHAITVNSGFFQLCPAAPGPAGLSPDKAAGLRQCVGLDGDATANITGTLHGTGYDGAAAGTDDTVHAQNGNLYVYGGGSGWLTGRFPVAAGETITMRIIVLDTFDGLKDSAVLLDKLTWEPVTGSGVQRPPPIR